MYLKLICVHKMTYFVYKLLWNAPFHNVTDVLNFV